MELTTVIFEKAGTTYKIISYESSTVDISELLDMKEMVHPIASFLNKITKEDGQYKWVGTITKKRVKYHATTKFCMRLIG